MVDFIKVFLLSLVGIGTVKCQSAFSLDLDPDNRLLVLSGGSIAGTACYMGFDIEDASVICRQLGYSQSGGYFMIPNSGLPHALFNIRCNGSESSIQECVYDTYDQFSVCFGHEDIALDCMSSSTGSTVSIEADGRVLAHTMNGVGTVCGYMWDDVDAEVVCRQMGFSTGHATLLPQDPVFTRAFYDVNCLGNETEIQSCHAYDYDISLICSMFEDAGVSCSGMPSGGSPSIAPDGRVLAHNVNGTGTVCGYMWDDIDADVLCRQMGFPSGTAMLMPRDPVFNRFVFNVNCLGNETDVQSCHAYDYDVSGMCSMYEDAGVSCSGMTSGGHTDVTIGPGGRVLTNDVNGTGTVCGDQWDDIDANVLCRQMGFASGTAIFLPRDYMFNRHIFNVRCLGNETQVQECPVDMTGSCSPIGDAGVTCVQNGTTGSTGSTVSIEADGRVLAHTMNGVGTVCGYMWDDVDAEVVCRQMGFPSGTATLLPRDHVFHRAFFDVNCNGNETEIQSCQVFDYDVSGMCSVYEDAGVSCSGMTSGGSPSIAPDGRVLAHNVNGTGTVCGYMWDDIDADVLCRQMGFPSGTAMLMPRDPVFNRFVFNVNCLGHETDVQSCHAYDYDVSGMCSMYEDAGVSCSGMTSGGHTDVTIGPGGRVLTNDVNGTGTVCGDQWDDIDANVLCRQMGFASGTAIFLPRDYMFNRHIFNVRCLGNETQVQECPVDMTGSCSPIGDAGVTCVQNGTTGSTGSTVSIEADGRVLAHTMNGVGTVCGYMWDDVDAEVVCRQMGFPSGTATLLPRDHVFHRAFFDVNCNGNETEIQSCQVFDYDVSGMCSVYEDAGVSCSGMTSGGSPSIAPDGRVLAHNVNGTGTVCGYMWDDIDADVLCRQMGFPSGTAMLMPRDPVFNRFVFNVNCLGHETDVQSCHAYDYDVSGMCSMYEDAGVSCSGMTSGGHTDVTIGPGGRVLTNDVNGTGTVCGDQWDDIDANVLCRQMGFASGTAIFLPRDYMFNRHIFNVRCLGNETQVQECPVDMTGSCSPIGDAGVTCVQNGTTGSTGSTVSIEADGRVLAHTMNGVGTVCGYMWDDVDAEVVCRQMGFSTGHATLLPQDPVFTRAFYDVNCLGNETEIQSCHAYDYDISLICSMFEDAGVSCSGMPSGGSPSIAPDGRVLAHNVNGTGTVCGYMWDDIDADVLCRQMGFPSGTAMLMPRDPVFNRFVFNVNCLGHETDVQSCHAYDYDVSGMCSMYEDAGVSCSGMTSGGHTDVTIGPGGRVLTNDVNGTGTVCGDQWDDIDANVLCRQMGFASGTAIFLPRDYMFNRHIFNVRCLGNETQVQECPVDMTGSCSPIGDAGVTCVQNGTTGSTGSTVSIEADGRVLAHTMNGVGTVCGYMWDDVDAEVVCRQMGFPSGTATLLPRDHVFNRAFFDVNCNGNETEIQSCQVFDYDVSGMCSVYEDAGVSCSGMTSGGSPSIAPDGRVLAHNVNGTGTVCGYMWDDIDADVLCRQMGFPSGTAMLMPRDPVFNRFVFNVNCLGHETDVQSCHAYDYDVSGMCSMYEDAGVSCSGMTSGGHTDVTIGPGGRVLTNDVNGTGTVCGDQWDDIDANVLCRQMGFASGTAIFLPRDYMFNRHIFNVRCLGNETQVQECPVDMTGSCSPIGDAGVTCVQNGTTGSTGSTVSIEADGRVLAHTMNGVGTVCGYMWDDVDAEVVCRQMGFSTGHATLLPQDPVFTRAFYDVNCLGNETEIQSCHAYDYDISLICSMFEDAGVSCSGMPSGGSPSIAPDGRVLAHNVNGTGTVCGYMWDDIDADVLCRQMGFPSGTAMLMPRDPVFNRFVFNVNCLGHETDVQSCHAYDYDVSGMCSMYEDAGVSCSGMTSGGHTDVTIGPGGRVLTNDVNGTGTVCGDQWDDIDANVLCRQMGFASGTAIFLPRDYMFNRHIFNVRCLGNETQVQECPVDMTGSCSPIGDAGVTCVQNGTTGSTGSTVSIEADGRVLAHTMNGVGTVCGYMWDDVDAEVVCRQMGFPSGTATLLPRDHVFNRAFFDVNCNGNETEIQSCQVFDYDVSGMCSVYEDAGVSCSGMTSGGSPSIAPDGRVLAHNVNGTGTVCGYMWDDIDADVLCRQMGFPSGTAMLMPRDPVFNRFVFNVNCLGNETDVQSCHAYDYDVSGMCSMYEDAGVSCSGMTSGGHTDVTIGPGGRVLTNDVNGTGTVCGDQWDDIDANVLCRQMGFASGTAIFLPRDYMFNRHIFNVRCLGNETQVQECPVDMTGSCSPIGDAGVTCVQNGTTGSTGSTVSIEADGRVLAHTMNGVGTVCGYMWDDVDAEVVCRQMGFSTGHATLLPQDPVFTRAFYDVNCLGNETEIQSCHAYDYDISLICSMFEDAGVSCSGMPSGGSPSIAPDGRVLAHNVNGTGTVCGYMWDDIDADVLCRQMGFLSGTAMLMPRDPVFNRFVFNVNCLGNETDVQSCHAYDYDVSGMCSMHEDAGVLCSGMTSGGHTDVTIGPGGRVLTNDVNGTGTVCGDQWDDIDANVLCRQMGFASGTAIFLPRDYMFNRHIFNVHCLGNETQVQECPVDMTGSCSPIGDAGVTCVQNGTTGSTGSTVSIEADGRVLAHTMNGVGTVCGYMWDDVDAEVVCRQMGFSTGHATLLPQDPVFTRAFYDVNCLGNETEIQSCHAYDYDISLICSMFEDAGVSCSGMPSGGSPSIAPDGRVLAHNVNGTGTVCGYMWDDIDADVLCRQMGFPSGTAMLMPRDPVFNRFVFNVNCLGNETDVQSCHAYDYDVSGMCSMYEDAGVTCSGMTSGGHTDVSIGPGGRVLTNDVNGTGTVCGDQWDDIDANVLCRQMGFASGTAIFLPRDYMFNRHIFNVRCLGNETQVQECPVDMTGSCSPIGDAGVTCVQNGTTGSTGSTVSIEADGRVLAHTMNGVGTVCGYMWDDVDAEVVCRQMGFPSGTATLLPRDHVFNRAFFDVNCNGNETEIQSCLVFDYDVSGMCSVYEDAGVSCSGMTSGGSPSIAPDGRVLAHNVNGTGTVCGYMWDDIDADVLCRQMGFPSGTAMLMPRDPVFNRFVFNVNCLGNETDVQSCHAYDYDVSGMCSMYEDAGVTCSGMTSGGHTDVTIGPGGRVLTNDVNGTGTVCGDQWDDIDANVLCRQMGFASGTAIFLPRDYMFNRHIFNVRCLGNETQVQECPVDMTGSCSPIGDAGVTCVQNGTTGSTGSTVSIEADGRVLAHTMNGVGTVCGYMWDDVDAEVVCRQMGFPSGTATLLPRDHVFNRAFFDVNCNGNETEIQSCLVFDYDVSGMCSVYEDAGVSCSGMTSGGSPSIAPDGRVLAHNVNGTGTVCGYMWDDIDADVLCRQMGFPSGTAMLMPRDPVFNRFVFNVNCLGNETDVQSCHAYDYDVSGMCSMYEDAGVTCSGMTSGGHTDVTIGPGGRVLTNDVNGTGTVCGDQWDDIDANVLCRQMGFASGTAIFLPRDYMFNRHIFNVRCLGNETQVQECPVDMTGSCSPIGDAGVTCVQNGTTGSVNTVYIGQNGRVMAAHNVTGYTGTVCGYLWDDLDAMVLCQQFGYISGIAKQMPIDHNYDRAIFNVQCTGMESDVYACPVDHSDTTGNCTNANDAGVVCENMTLQYPSTQTTITQTFAGQTTIQQASTQVPYSQSSTQHQTTYFSQSSTEQQTTQFPQTSQVTTDSSTSQQTPLYPYTNSQSPAGQTSTQQFTTQVPQTSSQASSGQNTTHQVTTQIPQTTSQVSAGQPTTQQATTQVPQTTSHTSAGYTTTEQVSTHFPQTTSQASAVHTTTQYATTQIPQTTSHSSAGQPTTQQASTQAPSVTSQATAGQTTTQQATTQGIQTTSQATSQVPQTTSQASAGQTSTQQATTQALSATSQASAGQTTTQQATTQVPQTTSQASAGQPTTQQASTQAPSVTSQASLGQTTTQQATTQGIQTTSQTTTQVPQTTSQASAGQTTTQQATTQAPSATSQASAGQTTTQQATTQGIQTTSQATTQVPQTTSQASAGQTTTQQATTQAPSATSQASAGQITTQQATTQVPQTTSQASAGQTTTQHATTQAPSATSQASAGQTTIQQATTQVPQTTSHASTQVPQTTSQASAGQTTTQATTQAPSATSQASAGQTTTQQATTQGIQTTSQATTQVPHTTSQASGGQTTTQQATTQAPSTTSQASAGQTTTPSAGQSTQAQTTEQSTSINCQPGSGSCILQMDSLGAGGEMRMASGVFILISSVFSVLCLVFMY